jgi:hypothetical protein
MRPANRSTTGDDSAVSTHELTSPAAGAGQFAFHPYALATAPVVALYAGNLRATPVGDVVLPFIVVLSSAVILVLMLRLVLNAERAALAASLFVLPFLSSDALFQGTQTTYIILGGDWLRYRYFLAGWGIFTIASLIWIWRTTMDTRKLTVALNLFSAMFLLLSVLSIGVSVATEHSTTRPRATTSKPAEIEIVLRPPEPPRDIYFLVFDRYADDQTLRREFGHDNATFYERLRDRGFYVATDSRANYPSTGLSMASCLNMTYLGEWLGNTDDAGLIAGHRVGALLKHRGYKYHHLGNLLDALRSNQQADVNYRFSTLPSEFAETLYQTTPLGTVFPVRGTPAQVRRQFELVEEAASNKERTFVYSHFLLPHPPYLFDRDGSELSHVQRASRSERENYVNQLIFTNDRIIKTIDRILARSETRPIILLQADEGPWLMAGDMEKGAIERIRKRTGILMALYLPDRDAERIVPPRISPVNVFRLVFREYFDAQIDLLDDKTFYWEHATAWGAPDYSRPSRFIDVTERLRAGDAAGKGA